jgi:hypothetical protein
MASSKPKIKYSMVSTPPSEEYEYDEHYRPKSNVYKDSTAGISAYIDESHANHVALKAASKNLQNLAQDIEDYT